MRLTLLGTGTPILDGVRCGSATLIEMGAGTILVDAGRGLLAQVAAVGLHPKEIDVVLITHHHHDHISSLGELFMTAWHNGRTAALRVFGPPGTRVIVDALIQQVYARDIAFALLTEPETIAIGDVLQVEDLEPGIVCSGQGWQIVAEDVDHGHGLGLTQAQWPCLGYRIEEGDRVVAISGDAVDCSGLDRLAQHADLLIQCCYLAEAEIVTPLFRRLSDHVIASSGQVGTIASRNGVKHLVLTHLRPKPASALQTLLEDVREVYNGEVTVAQDLMVFDISP